MLQIQNTEVALIDDIAKLKGPRITLKKNVGHICVGVSRLD